MSNVFTLDSLREEAEKEFAPSKIELSDGSLIVLRNILRLGKKDRELVLEALDGLNSSKDDAEEEDGGFEVVNQLADNAEVILSLVASDSQRLLEELDGDVALMMSVIEKWMGDTQPGEASNSPD